MIIPGTRPAPPGTAIAAPPRLLAAAAPGISYRIATVSISAARPLVLPPGEKITCVFNIANAENGTGYELNVLIETDPGLLMETRLETKTAGG